MTLYGVTRPQWVNYPSWTGGPTEPHCFRATCLKVVTLWDTFLHHCTNKRPQPPIFSQTCPCFLLVPLKYYSTLKSTLWKITSSYWCHWWKFPFVYYLTNLHLLGKLLDKLSDIIWGCFRDSIFMYWACETSIRRSKVMDKFWAPAGLCLSKSVMPFHNNKLMIQWLKPHTYCVNTYELAKIT